MLDPGLLLLVKMAVAATVVVGCSVLAERAGPFVAALIATLPISAGPVYVFLALQHDDVFIASSGLTSTYSNLSNAALCLAYVLLAQRHGLIVSYGVALVCWVLAGALLMHLAPPVSVMLVATVVTFALLHWYLRPYMAARPPRPAQRLWYAIPVRAAGVAIVAGTVSTISGYVGPGWSGLMAAIPVVFSSLIVILHLTIGGPACAAVIANSALGLIGFGAGLASLHLFAEPLGRWPALAIGLAICAGWNLLLMAASRRAR